MTLTPVETAAVHTFVRRVREIAAKTGYEDTAYMEAAIRFPREYAVFKRVVLGSGRASIAEVLARFDGVAAA